VKISAVLLAGGESRRFGSDKALSLWNGIPLWRRQLSTLQETGAGEFIISARTDPPWRPPDLQFVADQQPPCGPIGGLASALAGIKGSHLLALAIDMPCMTPDYLRSLVARATDGCGIVPILNDEPEPLAAIYPREARVIVAGRITQSDLSLRSLTNNLLHAGLMRSRTVMPNEADFFRNINHPHDVANDSPIP
jgi:molybdopterin-guanine dinucleotide biosynthesis protein A